MNNSYVCACCGKEHQETPFSFAADYPDNYAKLTSDERDARAIISSDQCKIDGKEFWVRGCLEIPIHGRVEPFLWGLWANLWAEDFDLITDHWETEGRENKIGLFKGRLGNSLSLYPETANLRLTIQIQQFGLRPLFLVDDRDHLLYREQNEGISLDKAREYSCLLMRMVK